MGFPDRLRELREKRNLTQPELGKIFNLSKQAISSYENGGSRPTQETLIKMAEFFDVDIYYLLGLSDDNTTYKSKQDAIIIHKKETSPQKIRLIKKILDLEDDDVDKVDKVADIFGIYDDQAATTEYPISSPNGLGK